MEFAAQNLNFRFVGLRPLNPPLLEVIGTITIGADTEPFVAREKFVVSRAPVKISSVGYGLTESFLGKVEAPMPKRELRYSTLTRPSLDGPIMEKLGGAKETTLAEIYALIQRQANGEEGVLLTNGGCNIFYVLDINGELCMVGVVWSDGGWVVGAISVTTNLSKWGGFDRVFSRNS